MEKKYFEVEIIKNDNIPLEKFFHSDDIKKSNRKLQLTNKSIYAISKYYDAQWITDIILIQHIYLNIVIIIIFKFLKIIIFG